MENLKKQIASDMFCLESEIKNIKIDNESHIIDFTIENTHYWAKLAKNNKSIRKNTIRLNFA